MSLPREGSRVIREGIIVAEAMDWCKSPSAIVPYKIHTVHQVEGANTADSVRQTDCVSHVKGSLIRACYGDEPGTGGGVISGTHNAECEPKEWSSSVRAQDRNMVRDRDAWWMNHKNTWGRLAYVKDPKTYDTPKAKDIQPRMRLAQAATGTMTDAAPIGAGGATTQQPPTVSQDLGELLKGGAKGGPLAAELGLIGGLPAVMRGSMQRLNAAAGADAQRHRDDLAKQQGYKDEADFVAAMRKVQTDEKAKADAVRVSGKAKKGPCPCLVGKYIAIKPSCKATCGPTAQAHHIVPDKYLRYGTRNAGDRIDTSAGSAPYPSLDQGPAICLTGNAGTQGSEHNTAHKNDKEIERLGANSATPGTLDLGTVQNLSVAGAIAARPDCAPQIVAEVGAGFENIDPASLVRATNNPPKPGSSAYDKLAPKPTRAE